MNTRIKKLRKALDLTQREFGERIGIKANTVTMIEKGRNTSEQTIQAICREFRVNEEWLRTGEGEMFQPEPRDALDELIAQYRLPREFRPLIDKYLKLTPDQQEAVVQYMCKVAAALMRDEYSVAGIPVTALEPWAEQPPAASQLLNFPEAPRENWEAMPTPDPNRHPDAPPWAHPGWTPELHAVYEAEARAEAERVYQRILFEKMEKEKSSGCPPGGTA